MLTNAQGTKVTGVEYYDEKKERQVQEASVVVLAAWSAQNPRLLLNSATDKHPEGARQCQRPRRQIHDDALQLGHMRRMFDEDVAEPHGHDRRAVHVLRPLRQDQPIKDAFGSSFIVAGTALKTSDSAVSPMLGLTCSVRSWPRS